MRRSTTDRGEVIHFAGLHRLSPALDDGARPAFSAASGDGLARCGWGRFFGAMRAAGLVLEHDPEDAASTRFVPAREARRAGGARAGLRQALDRVRRFWAALLS